MLPLRRSLRLAAPVGQFQTGWVLASVHRWVIGHEPLAGSGILERMTVRARIAVRCRQELVQQAGWKTCTSDPR